METQENPEALDTLDDLFDAILAGRSKAVPPLVEKALAQGATPQEVLDEGMIEAMSEVGRQFEAQQCFVPEMLLAARAMQAGLAVLKPALKRDAVPAAGRVIIGTVRGDMHDIGKNLVAMMLEGAGIEVIDLGIDVAPERFVAAILEHKPQVVALSALLTTTMPAMRTTVQALNNAGVRDKVRVLVGGTPVTQTYADQIGADGYAPDASSAVRAAKELLDAA
ncbi:MAG: corrinoid protein [Caldilineaceae bacterium]